MKSFATFSIVSIALLFNSCSTSSSPGLINPIDGRVQLEDSTGNPIPPPYSGITVTIPETNTSVTADSRGYWAIANPPQYPDNYNIVISKAGFGTLSFSGYYDLLDSTAWFPPGFVVMTLAPENIVHIEHVLYYDSTAPWVPVEIYPVITSKSTRVFIFIDTIPNIRSTGIHLSGPIEIYGHSGNNWLPNDGAEIGYWGFHRGRTIYISACAGSSSTEFGDSLRFVGPISNSYPVVVQ
ncbi:MAG TPA: hypothetical protein VGM92_00930 [Candidatus Kapabacteria bacterium]